MFHGCLQDEDFDDENFVTARNTMLQTAVGGTGTMISAEGAADDTITDLGTLVIVGEPDDVEEMDTMKSECNTKCLYVQAWPRTQALRGESLVRGLFKLHGC